MVFNYSKMTYDNRWKIKRWSHGARFKNALNLAETYGNSPRKVLDFGAGDGYFGELHTAKFRDCDFFAYDPAENMLDSIRIVADKHENIKPVHSISNIGGLFDIIYCLEVLEHLQDADIRKTVKKWSEIISDDGIAIISVPIETGLAAALKTTVRKLIGETHIKNKKAGEILRSFIGLKVKRDEGEYINSHFGFSHRRLRKLLNTEDIKIIKTRYSPISWLFTINSQCFWVIKFNTSKIKN